MTIAISKKCSKCGTTKPHDAFYMRSDTGKLRSDCKECFNEKNASRWRDDPAFRKRGMKRSRKHHLKNTYGMTEDEHKLFTANGCYVCGTMEDLAVDHDHTTGKVRGCLCRKHNTALGMLGDDIGYIKKLEDYLLRFGE